MIYNIEVKDDRGTLTNLEAYKGKVLLIVNTATHCGYTKQYDALEALYKTYQDKGFEILDFPCNQFLGQAPGSMDKINQFCELNFGTTFKRFNKLKVNTKHAHPLYKYLKENGPEDMIIEDGQLKLSGNKKAKIKWNFTKFLVDRSGHIVYRFAPKVEPLELKAIIESLL